MIGGSKTSIGIQYADIIRIHAPSNQKIDNHVFFVDYIDYDEKCRVIDIAELNEQMTFAISRELASDGGEPEAFLKDASIESIELLSRSEQMGFIRNNDLKEKQLIYIQWYNNPPSHCEIRKIEPEHDAFEIYDQDRHTTYWIDFEYKGLPDYMVRLRPVEKKIPTPVTRMEQWTEQDAAVEQSLHDVDLALNRLTLEGDKFVHEFIDESQLEDLDGEQPVEMYVEIDEHQKRYTLDVQTQDLSDTFYAKKPKYLLTTEDERNIVLGVHRFTELRHFFSTFKDGGIIEPKYAELRPMIRAVVQPAEDRFPYSWLYPVVTFKRNILINRAFTTQLQQADDTLLRHPYFNTAIEEDILHQLENGWNEYKDDKRIGIATLGGGETKFQRMLKKRLDQLPTSLVGGGLKHTVKATQEYFVNQSDEHHGIMENYFISLAENGQQYDIKNERYAVHRFLKEENTTLRSVMIFPLEKMKMSRSHLRKTSLYNKITYYPHTFSNKKWLKQVETLDPPPLDKENIYKPNILNFNKSSSSRSSGVSEFGLETIHYVPESDRPFSYVEFLKSVLPTTQYLIDWLHQTEDSFSNCYSVSQVVQMLEPFAIYYDNIRLEEFQMAQKIVQHNIRQILFHNKGELSVKNPTVQNNKKNDLFKLFASSVFGMEQIQKISSAYKVYFDEHAVVKKDSKMCQDTNSEMMLHMMEQDDNHLLTLSLLLVVSDWLTPEQFLSSSDSVAYDNTGTTRPSSNKMILKKYTNLRTLEKDNAVDAAVFVDQDLMSDITKQWIVLFATPEFTTSNVQVRREKIKTNLMQIYNVSNEDVADELTEIIVTGKQPIKDGDYALLETSTKTKITKKSAASTRNEVKEHVLVEKMYYKRTRGIWVLQSDLNDNEFQNIHQLLNQMNSSTTSSFIVPVSKGLPGKPGVATASTQLLQIQPSHKDKEQRQSVLYELERRYSNIVQEFRQQIQQDIDKQVKFLSLKREIKRNQSLSRNKDAKHLATLYESSKTAQSDLISPFVTLRDLILQQTSERKRFSDVQKFYEQHCRKAVLAVENLYWGYCIQTNSPLFPRALYEMAVAYNSGNQNMYRQKLNELCRTQGTISADGGSIIDQHSGYTLRLVDQKQDDTDSLDYHNLILQREETEQQVEKWIETLFISEEDKTLSLVFHFFNEKIGIHENNNRELFSQIHMIYIWVIHDSKLIMTESNYKSKLKQKGPNAISKEPSYSVYLDRIHIYTAVAAYFIIMQLNFDKIKRSNTRSVMNCNYSFEGYPLHEDTPDKNISGIEFLVCILQMSTNKSTVDNKPWSSLQQQSKKAMTHFILTIVGKITNNYPDIHNRILVRQAELKVTDSKEKTTNSTTPTPTTWTQFLPPLVPYEIIQQVQITDSNVNVLFETFKSAYSSQIAKSKYEQRPVLLKIKSYENILTLYLYESINQIVRQKTAVLFTKNKIPFLENMCCDENPELTFRNPLSYFIHNAKQPLKAIWTQSHTLAKFLSDIHIVETAPLLFYNLFPIKSLSTRVLLDETMKKSIIHYFLDLKYWHLPTVQKLFPFQEPPPEYSRGMSYTQKSLYFNTTYQQQWPTLRSIFPKLMNQIYLLQIQTIQITKTKQEITNSQFQAFIHTLDKIDNNSSVYLELNDFLIHNDGTDTPNKIAHWTNTLQTTKEAFLRFGKLNQFTGTLLSSNQPVWTNLDTQIVYYKNAIRTILYIIPNQIIHSSGTLVHHFSKHYDFSENHYQILKNNINQHRQPFQPFCENEPFCLFLQRFLNESVFLADIFEHFPEYLFSDQVVCEFYGYLFVEIIYKYIETHTIYPDDNISNQMNHYIQTLLDFLQQSYQVVSLPYSEIVRKTQIDANREKHRMMQQFANMADENRKSELMIKFLKLDDWNVGSEIFVYNKNHFDKETSNNEPTEPHNENTEYNETDDDDAGYNMQDTDYEEEYEGDGNRCDD